VADSVGFGFRIRHIPNYDDDDDNSSAVNQDVQMLLLLLLLRMTVTADAVQSIVHAAGLYMASQLPHEWRRISQTWVALRIVCMRPHHPL